MKEFQMKHLVTMATCAIALSILPASAFAQSETKSKEATSGKITDSDHPDYIRCRTESVIGSRAKKRKVCLTNREWEEFARRGNAVARRTVESNASGLAENN
ncbi:MAG: hypothetical protein CMN71_08805 [Sphingomonadaceae bacterium]|nr:hypothetical protein [Sphingomonadaceae bacterium]